MGWREIFREEQAKLPRNASPKDRGEATKRAADRYHGRSRNPSGLMRYAVYGGIGYLAYKYLWKKGSNTTS